MARGKKPSPLVPTPDPVIVDDSLDSLDARLSRLTPDTHECYPRMTQEPDPVQIAEEHRLLQSDDEGDYPGMLDLLTDILTEVREINQTLKRYCR